VKKTHNTATLRSNRLAKSQRRQGLEHDQWLTRQSRDPHRRRNRGRWTRWNAGSRRSDGVFRGDNGNSPPLACRVPSFNSQPNSPSAVSPSRRARCRSVRNSGPSVTSMNCRCFFREVLLTVSGSPATPCASWIFSGFSTIKHV